MLSVSSRAEIVHVLYMDIVEFSRCSMDEQRELALSLRDAVRAASAFRRADERGEILSLPTGDGMALVFTGDHLYPVQCALEIARIAQSPPCLRLRMGIHSGPADRLEDINCRENVYGGGINEAQRVMSCGKAGHILLSASAADFWKQRGQWQGWIHELGDYRVKHGASMRLYNLVTSDCGNRSRPPQPTAHHVRNMYLRNPLWGFFLYLSLSITIYLSGVLFGRAQAAAALASSSQEQNRDDSNLGSHRPFQ